MECGRAWTAPNAMAVGRRHHLSTGHVVRARQVMVVEWGGGSPEEAGEAMFSNAD